MFKHFTAGFATRIARLTLFQFLCILAATRFLLLALLWFMAHGHELSNDVAMHMGMVRSPLSVLLYTIPAYEQHPPFLPVLETVIAYPLQLFLPDFIAIRLLMISYEIALGYIFFRTIRPLSFGDVRKGLCLAAFIALPTGWMTSTVMAQDDSIAACAFLLPLLCYITGRKRLGLFFSGVGVVAAKLFIVLELFSLIPLSKRRNLIADASIGLSPIVLVYGAMTVHRIYNSFPPPLLGFRPDPYFGTSFWMVLHRFGLDLYKIGPYSGFAALLASTIPTVLLVLQPAAARNPRKIVIASGATLLIFFSIFYHVEPEYFTIIMPALILASDSIGDAISVTLLAILLWVGKFFQNASFLHRANDNTGKYLALDLFQKFFHSSPLAWLTADQIVFSLLTFYLCIRWVMKLKKTNESSQDVITPHQGSNDTPNHLASIHAKA